jgi:hypothetical protein
MSPALNSPVSSPIHACTRPSCTSHIVVGMAMQAGTVARFALGKNE